MIESIHEAIVKTEERTEKTFRKILLERFGLKKTNEIMEEASYTY